MKIHLATTPEEQKTWLASYRGASEALAGQKAAELRALTPEDALRDANLLLALAPSAYLSPERAPTSGLVEQQRLFARCH